MSEMSDWIKYDGKGQPVPDDVIVEVRLSDGRESDFNVSAQSWCWDAIDEGRITHYRIVGQERPVSLTGGMLADCIDFTGSAIGGTLTGSIASIATDQKVLDLAEAFERIDKLESENASLRRQLAQRERDKEPAPATRPAWRWSPLV